MKGIRAAVVWLTYFSLFVFFELRRQNNRQDGKTSGKTNKMSDKIAMYQIMMAIHQQDGNTSDKMTKHQRRWQNIAWYHKVSGKMIKHQHDDKTSGKGWQDITWQHKLREDDKTSA